MAGPNGWRFSYKLAVGVATLLPLAAALVWILTRAEAVAQTPAEIDSLRLELRQHIDTAAKYGRLQVHYVKTLCIITAKTERDRALCTDQ
jgi:hypothetical protein